MQELVLGDGTVVWVVKKRFGQGYTCLCPLAAVASRFMYYVPTVCTLLRNDIPGFLHSRVQLAVVIFNWVPPFSTGCSHWVQLFSSEVRFHGSLFRLHGKSWQAPRFQPLFLAHFGYGDNVLLVLVRSNKPVDGGFCLLEGACTCATKSKKVGRGHQEAVKGLCLPLAFR